MGGKFIIVIVVALFFIAFIQLMKIYQLADKVRGLKSQEKVTRNENMIMANLMLVFMCLFFGFTIWLIFKYGANSGLYEAATIHGKEIDDLLMFNWYIILPVFFGTNFLLFFFSWKYYHREERKATFISHNNKLEFFWTVIPATVLAFIVIYGIRTWNEIMYNNERGQVVEIYAYQFGWRIRYAGEDNVLGKADYKLVSATNPLGVITDKNIKATYAEIDAEVRSIDSVLSANTSNDGQYLLPNSQVKKNKEKLERLKRRKYRIQAGIDKGPLNDSIYAAADDDFEDDLELRLIKDQPYTFIIRSKDVIHSPWFPHFRAQINAVPGMETNFKLTPTTTTAEMREKPEVIEHYNNLYDRHQQRLEEYKIVETEAFSGLFDYVLLCNKICGAGHSNMQLDVVVETQQEYNYNVNFKKSQKKSFQSKLDLLSNNLVLMDSSNKKLVDSLIEISKKNLKEFEEYKDNELYYLQEDLKVSLKINEQISDIIENKDNYQNELDYKQSIKQLINKLINESDCKDKKQLANAISNLSPEECIDYFKAEADISLNNFGNNLNEFNSAFENKLKNIETKIENGKITAFNKSNLDSKINVEQNQNQLKTKQKITMLNY